MESVATNLLEDPSVGAIVVNYRNITERKKAEEALRASEERFSKAFHGSPNGMSISRIEDGAYIDVNERWLQMIKLPREKVIGRTSQELKLWANPNERQRMLEMIQREGSLQTLEINFCTASGETFLALLSAEAIEIQGQRCILAAIEDITEKKKLEDQLRQSQKLEAIGRLAGGVAHDFNNLLGVMMGRSELLLDRLNPDNSMRSHIEEIHKASESAARLTRQLLAFSRKQILEPRVLDLNRVVQEMQRMLRRLIGEDIELTVHLEADLGHIKADPGQIEQVLMNLVVNARDAMPHGGRLTIQTSKILLDESNARLHQPVNPGAYVLLEISDTGIGMDPATQARIFEPFFTTKEKGKGTGLGLATVYGIVKQSDGYIWLSSEVGKGSSFKIYLPRVDEPAAERPPAERRTESSRGSETILVVEDDSAVRTITVEFLQHGGYSVLEAGGGEEALGMAQQHAGPIHLLLTDVVLPGGSGAAVGEQLAAIRPEIKVLYVSGYSDLTTVEPGLLSDRHAFLQKPFGCDALLQKVRSVLDAAAVSESPTAE